MKWCKYFDTATVHADISTMSELVAKSEETYKAIDYTGNDQQNR
jgi:hypothetical protein